MIIFDTSALFGLGPDDPKLDLLRALRQSGKQQVAIPWMVQEELVAHRVLRHAKAHAEAVTATRALNRTAPWAHEPEPGPFAPDAPTCRSPRPTPTSRSAGAPGPASPGPSCAASR